MKQYIIIRHYQDSRPPRVMQKGLTLEQAQEWCNDPETSSMTAKQPRGCSGKKANIERWHQAHKHWFDSYQEVIL